MSDPDSDRLGKPIWTRFRAWFRNHHYSISLYATLAILLFVGYRLSQIGLNSVAENLPSSPVFYSLSVTFILVSAGFDARCFSVITQGLSAKHFLLFVQKYALNKTIFAFAGDAFLMQGLATRAGMTIGVTAVALKDMALSRTFVANGWIIILILLTFLLGRGEVVGIIWTEHRRFAVIAILVCVGFCLATLLFFKRITRLPPQVAVHVTSLYLFRAIVLAFILAAQWATAIPGTRISIWLLLLVVFYISKKSPVGGEFMFVGVALSLPDVGLDKAALAGVVIAVAATSQLLCICVSTSLLWTNLRRSPGKKKKSENYISVKS